MRILFIIFSSLFLSACLVSNDVRMSSEHAQFIDKVGVISVLDDYAVIHYAAQEPKDIIDRRALIDGWNINSAVGNHIVQRLTQKGFNARLLDVDVETAQGGVLKRFPQARLGRFGERGPVHDVVDSLEMLFHAEFS